MTRLTPLCVSPQPFACALEGAAFLERGLVVHKRRLRAPRQFDEIIFPDRDAFAEILRGDVALLQHVACFELDLPD